MIKETQEYLAKIKNWELDNDIGEDKHSDDAIVYKQLQDYFTHFYLHFCTITHISAQLDKVMQDFIRESSQIEQVAVFLKKGVGRQTVDIEKSVGLLEVFTEKINSIYKKSKDVISLAHDMENNNRGVQESMAQLVTNQSKNDEAVQRIFDLISSLIVKTNKIGDITKLINRISSETNLLGLNAKVEAVRAGAVGKGFSVVAEEIQRLSRESSDASSSINDTIKSVTAEIGLLEKAAQQSQEIFAVQRDTVNEVSAAYEKNSSFIKTYIDEQLSFTADIEDMKEDEGVLSDSISNIFSSVREISATANEISSLTYNQNSSIALLGKLQEDLDSGVAEIETAGRKIKIKKAAAQKKKVAVIFDSDIPFWNPTIKETKKAAEAYHYDVVFYAPKSAGMDRVKDMVGYLDEIIENKCDGVVISPVNHDLISQKLQEMNRLGIKIVFINSKLDGVDFVSLIQTEGIGGGVTAAKAVMGALGGQGEVIVNTWGDMHISAIEDRKKGFVDELRKKSKIKVIEAPVYGKATDDQKEAFDAIMRSAPQAKYIFLTNCEWGKAFIDYKKKYRIGIQIVTFDFTKDIQEAMNEGLVQYAIGQRAYSWGSMALVFLDCSFRNKPVKKFVDTGTFEINQQNLNIYNSIV